MGILNHTYGKHYTMVVVRSLFGSSKVGSSYIQSVVEDDIVSIPVEVGTNS